MRLLDSIFALVLHLGRASARPAIRCIRPARLIGGALLLIIPAVFLACQSDRATAPPDDLGAGDGSGSAAGGKGGGKSDQTPPTVPGDLSAIVQDTVVELTWSQSTDDSRGKVKYEVYRDGSYLTEAANNDHSDYDVLQGTTYSYQVLAFDKAGNKSELSLPVSVTLPGDPPPPPPAPTCELMAYPETVASGGSSTVTLTASGSYTSATLNSVPVTLVDDVYTEIVFPEATTEYVGTVEGPGGSSSCTTTVTVDFLPPPPPPPEASCLVSAESVELATSATSEYFFDSFGHAVDASGVSWIGDGTESNVVRTEGLHQSCFAGGAGGAIVDGGIPFDAVYECQRRHCPTGVCPSPCFAYHSAAGIAPDVTNLQVFEDLLIRKTGDGISLRTDAARDVVARRIYMYEIHDDAFESDFGLGGFLIEDALVESAYVGFAMRLRNSAQGDQRDKVWNIRNNLVRLVAFPNTYKQRPGHGNLFKLQGDSNEPIFRLVGNTFVLGPVLGGETLMPPVSRTQECADNTILWTGTQAQWDSYQTADDHPDGGDNGQRLAALNGTFGATCMQVHIKPDGMSAEDFLNQEGWYALVDAWKASHVAGGLN